MKGGITMKLPNGYGSVYKLSGKRRKPWVAAKTSGYDDEGKQLRSIIGYYVTKPEALQALAQYNETPYDLKHADVSFAEIYKQWFDESFNADTNRSTVKNYNAAYKHCTKLYDKKFKDIKASELQKCLDECPCGYNTASRMKIMFNQLYRYCMQRDIVHRNLTESLKVKQKYKPSTKDRFSSEELDTLWRDHKENEFIPFILIMIYSGCRINELLNLKKEDVHFEQQYFDVVSSKTDAGIRKVPIADKVLPFWINYFNNSKCNNVFTTINGKTPLTYDNFKRRYWNPICDRLGMNHSPHETRHTCISMLKTVNANDTFIKIIVGHKSIMDLTERTYTHIEIKDLLATINMI